MEARAIKRFCRCALEAELSTSDAADAGEVIRRLTESPAWFAICKKVEGIREGSMARKHPNTMTLADYGISFGTETACNAFLRIFDELLEEAADARKRKDELAG